MRDIYEKMYYTLFNVVTDALKLMDQKEPDWAKKVLMEGQIETEDMFINAGLQFDDLDDEAGLCYCSYRGPQCKPHCMKDLFYNPKYNAL